MKESIKKKLLKTLKFIPFLILLLSSLVVFIPAIGLLTLAFLIWKKVWITNTIAVIKQAILFLKEMENKKVTAKDLLANLVQILDAIK
jgi:hypothetical protein